MAADPFVLEKRLALDLAVRVTVALQD